MGSNSFYLFISFLVLYCLPFSPCYTLPTFPGKSPSSAGLGQQLGSIGSFLNSNNNLTLLPILESDNYLAMASLSRGQSHRFDTGSTQDFCNINLQYPLGVWVWATPCEPVPTGDTCYAALSSDGDLQILDGTKVIWSSGTAGQGVKYVEVTNSGELELLNGNNAIVWRSSDHLLKGATNFCNGSVSAYAPASSPPSGGSTPPPLPGAPPIPTLPGKPVSSAGLGQQLGSIGPFPNDRNNLTLLPILESNDYLSLASLSRGQAHRYDTGATQDYCNINVQHPIGVWVWTTPCEPIPTGDTCSAALSSDGDLQILDGTKVLWSSGTAGEGVKYVELTNFGELELLNANNVTVWKSSDHVLKFPIDFCNVSNIAPASSPSYSSPSPAAPAMPSAPSSSYSPGPGMEAEAPGEGPSAGHSPESSAIALYISSTATILSSGASVALLLLFLG